jgi:hypothetical protein
MSHSLSSQLFGHAEIGERDVLAAYSLLVWRKLKKWAVRV